MSSQMEISQIFNLDQTMFLLIDTGLTIRLVKSYFYFLEWALWQGWYAYNKYGRVILLPSFWNNPLVKFIIFGAQIFTKSICKYLAIMPFINNLLN